jgi:eukaryotic-like serine/threonine-protein kinase
MSDIPDDATLSQIAVQASFTSIGPYRLIQMLGVGGMGEVWRAEQTEPLHRIVALKLIKAGMDTKAVVARFDSERQALALMEHPNIAKVLDAGATPSGRPYFVMEFVHGLAITDYCDKHRFTIKERLALFIQVCEGVQHAHQKAIIHRDLKPSNVLVEEVDNKPVPKIIDFGLAKAMGQRLTEMTMFTEAGAVLGTPDYMSPEQADRHERNVDTRTDVYSLGVILYELLVGALPFGSQLRESGVEAMLQMICQQEPPRPSTKLRLLGQSAKASAGKRREEPQSLERHLRGELDWITIKALEKDRTRRYGSASDLAADIQRHLQDQPVLAGPPSASYRASKFIRRHKAGLAAVALLALSLIGGMVATLWEAHIARAERARAEANLGLASKAVDESLSSAGDQQARESADPPQLERFRQELLKKAEEFYSNSLAKQSKNGPKFRADSALVHSKLGDINRLLEKREDAVVQYRLAISGFEELHREKPGNADYGKELAYAHHWLGETLRLWLEETRNTPYKRSDAETEYDSALRLQQDLHQVSPQNADYAQALARTYYNRGILRYDGGDLVATESDFREAARLLEPLAEKELESQTKESENPPSHDLARVCNNLGILLSDQGDSSRAQESFERAIRVQGSLTKKSPENWEYKVELARFYNNLSFLLWSKGEGNLAAQRNHQALDLLEELATPVSSLESERAKAHILHHSMGPSEHPEFHILYKHLGDEYVKLATEYVNSGFLDAARLAIEALRNVLPEVAEPDRTRLAKSYQDLVKNYQKARTSVNSN